MIASTTVNMLNLTAEIRVAHIPPGELSDAFDVVYIMDGASPACGLYVPIGRGEALAEAFRAALAPLLPPLPKLYEYIEGPYTSQVEILEDRSDDRYVRFSVRVHETDDPHVSIGYEVTISGSRRDPQYWPWRMAGVTSSHQKGALS